jgi:hypothetical protein
MPKVIFNAIPPTPRFFANTKLEQRQAPKQFAAFFPRFYHCGIYAAFAADIRAKAAASKKGEGRLCKCP